MQSVTTKGVSRRWRILASAMTLAILALMLAACTLAIQPISAPTPEADSPTVACPTPGEGQTLLTKAEHGYCVLLPAGFEPMAWVPYETVVYGPSTTPGHRERAFVSVTGAFTRTVGQFAEDLLLDMPPEFGVTRTEGLTLGGEPAILLENMPGQDISRQLLAIHNGRAYRLIFVPDDPEMSPAYEEMTELYDLALDSFAFLPDADVPLLVYRGEGPSGACLDLRIESDGVVWVGECEGELAPKGQMGDHTQEWASILAHFGPADLAIQDEQLIYWGQGEVVDPVWSYALVRWAGFTASELSSGRTSASVRTILAWQLGELPDAADQCARLTVLAYGYAYALAEPCAGGESQLLAQGWLETEEMQRLDDWITARGRLEGEEGYFDGQGPQAMSAEEEAALMAWMEAVYDRLVAQAQ